MPDPTNIMNDLLDLVEDFQRKHDQWPDYLILSEAAWRDVQVACRHIQRVYDGPVGGLKCMEMTVAVIPYSKQRIMKVCV